MHDAPNHPRERSTPTSHTWRQLLAVLAATIAVPTALWVASQPLADAATDVVSLATFAVLVYAVALGRRLRTHRSLQFDLPRDVRVRVVVANPDDG